MVTLMKTLVLVLAVLVASPAFAVEATVTLTQAELQSIVNAQVAQALTQAEIQKAGGALKKVQDAFAPAAPVAPGPLKNLTPPGVEPN